MTSVASSGQQGSLTAIIAHDDRYPGPSRLSKSAYIRSATFPPFFRGRKGSQMKARAEARKRVMLAAAMMAAVLLLLGAQQLREPAAASLLVVDVLPARAAP
jgi:hypothetical protein